MSLSKATTTLQNSSPESTVPNFYQFINNLQLSVLAGATPFQIMKRGSAVINDFIKIGIAFMNVFVSALFIVILWLYLQRGNSQKASSWKLKKVSFWKEMLIFWEKC
jgi:hypothetical protein